MEKQKKLFFPLFIDLSEKKIVVIGGGNIAQRRVETLLPFTQNILVVAPEATDKIKNLDSDHQIQWIRNTYHESILDGADIVLAATNDPFCNEAVAKDCKAKKIPVNTAHNKDLCDFYFPGISIKDPIVAGVTANGLSHKGAKKARECISRALEEFEELD